MGKEIHDRDTTMASNGQGERDHKFTSIKIIT